MPWKNLILCNFMFKYETRQLRFTETHIYKPHILRCKIYTMYILHYIIYILYICIYNNGDTSYTISHHSINSTVHRIYIYIYIYILYVNID